MPLLSSPRRSSIMLCALVAVPVSLEYLPVHVDQVEDFEKRSSFSVKSIYFLLKVKQMLEINQDTL